MTEDYLRMITREKGRQLITAGGPEQEALEAPEWGHSVFTYYLLEGLDKGFADLNNDGIIPASELYTYLNERVFTAANLKGHKQKPELWALAAEKGEFVFFASSTPKPSVGSSTPQISGASTEEMTAMKKRLEEMEQKLAEQSKAAPTTKPVEVARTQPPPIIETRARPYSFDEVPIAGDFWALIIGINRYHHLPSLQAPVNDAKAVRDMLINRYGFRRDRMTELYDDEATRSRIIDALDNLNNKVGEKDSVLIYYAGHGDKAGTRGYWLPVDAKVNEKDKFIFNSDISGSITDFKAKHVFLVVDAPFSEWVLTRGVLAGSENSSKYVAQQYAKKSRWVLASAGDQPVMDVGPNGHSVFAYYFLKVLRENSKAYLMTMEICELLIRLVSVNSDQRPFCAPLGSVGHQGGQFVFQLINSDGDPPSGRR